MNRPLIAPDQSVSDYLLTIDDIDRMLQAGVFDRAKGAVELIEGKLVHMAPARARHAEVTSAFFSAFVRYFDRSPAGAVLKPVTHGTLQLTALTAPEPDAMVVKRTASGAYYTAGDAVLVVEVAFSTLARDVGEKQAYYAAAGIIEYWVADVDSRTVHVFRNPSAEGFQEHEVLKGEEELRPLFARPDETFAVVRDLF